MLIQGVHSGYSKQYNGLLRDFFLTNRMDENNFRLNPEINNSVNHFFVTSCFKE
jgi:hypothetical protein